MTDFQQAVAEEEETRFKAWLWERAKDVTTEYERWLVNQYGDSAEGAYCPECIRIQRYIEKHNKTGYTCISGWDEAFTRDGPEWCERCGILLESSLTEYAVEQEIELMAEVRLPDSEQAYIWHEFLAGVGCYNQEKHWPLIAPHAQRFMEDKP